jgi:hypothetical protein
VVGSIHAAAGKLGRYSSVLFSDCLAAAREHRESRRKIEGRAAALDAE